MENGVTANLGLDSFQSLALGFLQSGFLLPDNYCTGGNNELPELGVAHTWTSRSFRAFYSQRIAIALQRGNAKAIRLQALSDMRVDGNPDMEPPAVGH